MSWEEGGLGEGTFPQRKASFVLDVVWDVAFDESGGMILEIDEAVYSGGMLRGPACFRRFYRKSGAFFSSRKRRHGDSRAGAWGPDNRFRIARVPRPEARRRPASPPVYPLRAVARRGMIGLPHAGLPTPGCRFRIRPRRMTRRPHERRSVDLCPVSLTPSAGRAC